MTSDQKRSFERQWPELSRSLRTILARRNISASDREDIIQDTALRLLKVWDKIDHGRPILPFAITIAMNLLRDRMRRPLREVALEAAADAPARSDVEREGLTRMELERVAKAMEGLSETHRMVLLQEVDGQPRSIERGADAMKMLRMRARRRLVALLETASAFVGLTALKIRNMANDVGHSSIGAIAAAAVIATLPATNSVAVTAMAESGVPKGFMAHSAVHSTDTTSKSLAHLAKEQTVEMRQAVVASAPRPEGQHHPVKVPIGNGGEVEAEGIVDVDDLHFEVSDRGGPVPVCLDGAPGVPNEMSCTD